MTRLAEPADTVPIQGYDRLAFRSLVTELRQRSQEELTQIDAYERAHQERGPVLEKLRYLRGPEPLEAYDALDIDEILAAAADADRRRLGDVRSYETRMRERPEVLGGVGGLMRKGRPARMGEEAEPAEEESGGTRARYAGNKTKDAAVTVLIFGLIGLAAVLMLIALFILVCVIISTVAPTAL